MKQLFLICLIATATLLNACQKEIISEPVEDANYKLKITFNHKVGAATMQLGNTYQNPFNEAYTLTAFKFYISNIVLQQNNGVLLPVPNVYQLVDEAETNSKSFVLSLDRNQFNKITFLVGVDSARNVSGTQTGDLDPAKGMFWTWNTGYIMAKMEANSPVSTAPANKVEIHVGGFKTGENTLRFVTLYLAAGETIDIKEGGTSELVLEADANKWFNGIHPMRIADNPISTSPGTTSMNFADNYATMFKVAAVNN